MVAGGAEAVQEGVDGVVGSELHRLHIGVEIGKVGVGVEHPHQRLAVADS